MKRLSNGRRGSDLPMRVRRRQSDAKWRANVASCYETLKLIIPMNKRASKRQISKALILQETSKHINFLEHILETLLLERGHLAGEDDIESWAMERVRLVKNEFVETQKEKIAALNMERRYKRSRYKLMIADHLLPPGNHDNVTPSPSNTPCVSRRGKGKAPEPNWDAESEEKGKETSRNENPLSHLAQVVPEGQLPLQGNEAPGSYEASYRKTLEQQSHDPASSTSNDGDSNVVFNLQLVPDSTARGSHMYKVTTRQREKTPAFGTMLGKRPANLKLSAGQRVPSASHSRKQRELTDSHGADTVVKHQVALNRAKRVLDMDGRESGIRKKRAVRRPSMEISEQPNFTPVKSKQASTVMSFNPVKLPLSSWQLTPTSPGAGWMSPGGQMVPASPSPSSHYQGGDGDTQSLLCTEPMWLSSDEDGQGQGEGEEVDPCKMNEKTPVTSCSRRGKQNRKRKQNTSLEQGHDLGCCSGPRKGGVGPQCKEPSERAIKHRKTEGRRRPRCRRSLQLSFGSTDCESLAGVLANEGLPTQVPQLISPLLDDCNNPTHSSDFRSPGVFSASQIDTKDFDGYLMFYKQKLHQMEQSIGPADVHSDEVGLSKAVYESWCDLTDDQRQTMITLAITESASRHSDDSRLSDDLMAVDIQPMCKLEKCPVDGKVTAGEVDTGGKKAVELSSASEFWPLTYGADLHQSGHSDSVQLTNGKSPSPLLCAGSSHMDQDVPSMPFSALTSAYDDDDMPSQVCPTSDPSEAVTDTGNDDDVTSVKPLLVLTDKTVVSSLWCATDEPIEGFEYIGQFSPLLGHKLELFQ